MYGIVPILINMKLRSTSQMETGGTIDTISTPFNESNRGTKMSECVESVFNMSDQFE